MILSYVALAMLLICLVLVFYAFLYVHELPYEAAVHRKHPQQEAIYVACWLSLFTLHAIWPLVWIWAVSREGGGLAPNTPQDGQAGHAGATPTTGTSDSALLDRLTRLETQVATLQQNAITTTKEA